MLKWDDATNYKRHNDKTQTAWELHAGAFRIHVTKAHFYYPGRWISSILPMESEVDIGAADRMTEADAKNVALERFRQMMTKALAAIKE